MTPAASRAATATIALAGVVGLAILHRGSGLEVVLDKEGRVSLDVEGSQVDVAPVLDRVLVDADVARSEKVLAEAFLETLGPAPGLGENGQVGAARLASPQTFRLPGIAHLVNLQS